MKYVFLINSFSVKERFPVICEAIEKVCEEEKIPYAIEVNSENVSTEDIVRKYKKQKVIFMPVGGDGTLNRVLNEMVGTKNVLGYIPFGTGNDFHRYNEEIHRKGKEKIDLIKMNDRYFINVACFGIDADIGNESDIIHHQWIPKKQRYNMSILYHFLKYHTRKMKVSYDGETVEDDYTTVVLCNGRYYGGGYKVGSMSSDTDGVLDVYLVSKMSKVHMASLILGMKNAKHEKSPKVKKIHTKKLRIESEKMISCNMDGEAYTAKVFDIELIPKGVEIYHDSKIIQKVLQYKSGGR